MPAKIVNGAFSREIRPCAPLSVPVRRAQRCATHEINGALSVGTKSTKSLGISNSCTRLARWIGIFRPKQKRSPGVVPFDKGSFFSAIAARSTIDGIARIHHRRDRQEQSKTESVRREGDVDSSPPSKEYNEQLGLIPNINSTCN